MSDLAARAMKLAATNPELGPKVWNIMASTGSLRQMVQAAQTVFFNQVLTDLGGMIRRAHPDAKFVRWLHNSALTVWGADFAVRIPGTFHDAKVEVRCSVEGNTINGDVLVTKGRGSPVKGTFDLRDGALTGEVATEAFRTLTVLLPR